MLSLVLTAFLPLFAFLQIGSDLINYIPKSGIIIVVIVVIGILASSARYAIYQYPQYSVKRALFSLFNSSLILIYLALFSLLSSMNAIEGTTFIAISFTGVFLLLSLPWIVFLVRDVYNLIDFSLHEEDYIKTMREQRYRLKKKKKK